MKLHAKITSEKPTREAKKSGDEYLNINLYHKNKHLGRITVDTQGDEVVISYDSELVGDTYKKTQLVAIIDDECNYTSEDDNYCITHNREH